jgi:hypothetical protein
MTGDGGDAALMGTIGVLVVIYPFPRMMRMIKPKTTIE